MVNNRPGRTLEGPQPASYPVGYSLLRPLRPLRPPREIPARRSPRGNVLCDLRARRAPPRKATRPRRANGKSDNDVGRDNSVPTDFRRRRDFRPKIAGYLAAPSGARLAFMSRIPESADTTARDGGLLRGDRTGGDQHNCRFARQADNNVWPETASRRQNSTEEGNEQDRKSTRLNSPPVTVRPKRPRRTAGSAPAPP